jgi:predicted unusual protein kinase regulating ubiquinone biosynthesis (AarF/ABC1/UbiB family)
MFIFDKMKNLYDEFIILLLNKCINHNILFIKIFQSLSSNTYFSNKISNLFKKCTNNTNINMDDINNNILSNILNKYNIKLSSTIPINSGMISIVYKGIQIDSGKDIIVKIKKHNIENKIKYGFDEIVYLYNLFDVILYPFPGYHKLLSCIKSLKTSNKYLENQVNFENEINVIKKTYNEINKLSSNIIIPEVLNQEDDLINPGFIVMTYLDGKSCYEINENEKINYAKILLEYCIPQICFMTYVHSDLHPGNIIYMKSDTNELKVGIIDFGMYIEQTDHTKQSLYKICKIMYSSDDINKIDFINICNDIIFHHKLNINEYTNDILDKIYDMYFNLFFTIKSGKIDEKYFHELINKYNTIVNKTCTIKDNMIQILLSFTMIHSSIGFLLNFDELLLQQYSKEVIYNIMN